MSSVVKMTAVFCVLMVATSAAADLGAAARDIVAKHGDVVVPLRVVTSTKITAGGREYPARERQHEILGTVLDASGLIVASNTAADPSGSQMMQRPGMKVESEIKNAKLIKKDGTELALKIVLTDKDLDLIFLAPEEKAELANVGLAAKGAELALASDVVAVGRMGSLGDRQSTVTLSRVRAVVNKPRRFYVADFQGNMLGCPAFDAAGKLVGLVVVHSRSGGQQRAMAIVLPAADVAEIMAQAKEEMKE
jgi:hypothetical protein